MDGGAPLWVSMPKLVAIRPERMMYPYGKSDSGAKTRVFEKDSVRVPKNKCTCGVPR
jgi:hypothetical protein